MINTNVITRRVLSDRAIDSLVLCITGHLPIAARSTSDVAVRLRSQNSELKTFLDRVPGQGSSTGSLDWAPSTEDDCVSIIF